MEEGEPAKKQEKEKFENWRKTGSIPAAKSRDCLRRKGARCTMKSSMTQGQVCRTYSYRIPDDSEEQLVVQGWEDQWECTEEGKEVKKGSVCRQL